MECSSKRIWESRHRMLRLRSPNSILIPTGVLSGNKSCGVEDDEERRQEGGPDHERPHRRYLRSEPHLSLLIRPKGLFLGGELASSSRFLGSFLGRLSAIVVAAAACASSRALTDTDRRSRYKPAKAAHVSDLSVDTACPTSSSLAADYLSM